jgi:hypothetical protein
MLPSQHHASFSTTLKGFMVSLYAPLKPFQHKNQPTRLRDEVILLLTLIDIALWITLKEKSQ